VIDGTSIIFSFTVIWSICQYDDIPC